MIQPTISLEKPVPSQGHCGFHSFPVVDWFCLFIYLWVFTFLLEDCSEFGNFVITLIYPSFFLLINAAYSTEQQPTTMLWFLALLDQGSNTRSFALGVSTVSITPPMWLLFPNRRNVWYCHLNIIGKYFHILSRFFRGHNQVNINGKL